MNQLKTVKIIPTFTVCSLDGEFQAYFMERDTTKYTRDIQNSCCWGNEDDLLNIDTLKKMLDKAEDFLQKLKEQNKDKWFKDLYLEKEVTISFTEKEYVGKKITDTAYDIGGKMYYNEKHND